MKKFLNPSLFLSGLFFCMILLSSFSLEYSRDDGRDDQPQISKKELNRNKRLDKRKARLQKKIATTKSSIQRQMMQKRIRTIQKQQDDGFGTPVIGILGMVLAILAFILFIGFIASLFMTAVGQLVAGTSFLILIAGLVTSGVGLGLSIAGMVLPNKDPDKFSGRGFGLAGTIIASIMLGIFLIALFLYLLFL